MEQIGECLSHKCRDDSVETTSLHRSAARVFSDRDAARDMPLRNLWALEPDEVLVAEKLENNIHGCHVYFPTHDIGIDLLAVRGKKHLGVQVKGSRYYTANRDRPLQLERYHGWHQIKAKKIGDNSGADFYVFVTHIPKLGKHKVDAFEQKYLVVPAIEIERRVVAKKAGKKGVYSFYFRFDGPNVLDTREDHNSRDARSNYSEFLNNWDVINRLLG